MRYSITNKVFPHEFSVVSEAGPPKTILAAPQLIYAAQVRIQFLDCIQNAAKLVNTVRTFMPKPVAQL